MASKIGILGSGAVGLSLAKGFKKHGYEVQIGRREASGVDGWDGPVGTFSDVSAWGDLVIIALKGSIAEEVVESVTLNLADKTVIDTTKLLTSLAMPRWLVLHMKPSRRCLSAVMTMVPKLRFRKSLINLAGKLKTAAV
jgi:predicted dinucleotide-binding enzyme